MASIQGRVSCKGSGTAQSGGRCGCGAVVMTDPRVLPSIIDIVDERGAQAARVIPPGAPQPPLIPWRIHIAVTPGPAPAVILISLPRFVIPARPINNRAL